jgi:LysR family transcriptional regulator, benzoate and cis,cis-muconate-responsive activator of ben and cat genes
MAPGFYDMIVGTCRTAGFEPRLDEQATGNTVWGNLARGRGVVLINASLAEQLPPGVTLLELAHPAATLMFDAVWHEGELQLIQRSLEVAAELAKEAGWL